MGLIHILGKEEMTMKKYFILCLTTIAVAASVSSCTKEIAAEPEKGEGEKELNFVEMTFTTQAGEEISDGTRAQFGSNYPKIEWVKNDKVAVIGTNHPSTVCEFSALSSGESTTLSGQVVERETQFVALYPYQDNLTYKLETTTHTIHGVDLPAVQTAVAGGFDPKAFLFTALSDGETMSFYTSVALVKFKLVDDNAANIKSITLKNNGTEALVFDDAVVQVGSNYSVFGWKSGVSKNASTSVKLVPGDEGAFVDGAYYFFVIRPTTFSSGISVSVEYNDGTVISKISNNEFKPDKTTVLNLPDIPVGFTYSDAFELGYDVIVGDKTYNQSNISGTTIEASVTDLTASLSVQEGLFFLQGESYNITKQVVVSKNVVFCGNNPSKRTKITMGNSSYFTHNSSIFALKNLEINAEQCANYVINKNTTSDSESLLVDDCKISMLKPMLYIASGKGICKSVKLKDSDFEMKAATQVVQMQSAQSDTQFEFNMSNSIVYSSNASATRIVLLPRTTNQSNVELTNNTFYNYRSGAKYGLIHSTSKYSFVASNNLVVLPTYNNGDYFICSISDSDFTKISENYFCRTDNSTLNGKFYESGYTSVAEYFGTLATVEKKSVNDYPYRPSDIDAKYGAKR